MYYKVSLSEGKYEIILIEEPDNFKFEALRHGESWRNLVGDNLVLGLVYKIQSLEDEIEELKDKIKYQGD